MVGFSRHHLSLNEINKIDGQFLLSEVFDCKLNEVLIDGCVNIRKPKDLYDRHQNLNTFRTGRMLRLNVVNSKRRLVNKIAIIERALCPNMNGPHENVARQTQRR